jgi:hypothetical protein
MPIEISEVDLPSSNGQIGFKKKVCLRTKNIEVSLDKVAALIKLSPSSVQSKSLINLQASI